VALAEFSVAVPSLIADLLAAQGVPVDLARAWVDRAPAWVQAPGRVPLDAAPCTPPAPRLAAPEVRASVPAWARAPALALVQDSASAPAWVRQARCRLQAKLRARHVPVRAAVDARATKRPKKAR